MLFMGFSVRKSLYGLWICILAESATLVPLAAASSICQRDYINFHFDLLSQCPFSGPLAASPVAVDGESFGRVVSSMRNNEYIAVLFYSSWCPFSSNFVSKFSTLYSMYPEMKHIMVEQSSAMPLVFSRYGIHSVPSLLIVNQTTTQRYHGRKDLGSLVNFYKRVTGLYPMMYIAEDTTDNTESCQNIRKFWEGAFLKEAFFREPYLVLSAVFVVLRALLYFFPESASRLLALWVAYIPHLNLRVFGESRLLLGQILHLIDVKRIWRKLKLYKSRNFHEGARNARVWASSLASVSLGETSSPRVFPSIDLN